jgi:NADP-dependent aldehyde dehydrogenase
MRTWPSRAATSARSSTTLPTRPRRWLVNRTLGPVVVFGASNFPFAFSVLGNDTASALAAGCPVVAKAHLAHVALSIRLHEIASVALASAGAPRGILELVIGFEAGTELVRAPGSAAVAFTGSQAGGLALWHLANAREIPIPVFAEMGTVNPVVVTPAAVGSGLMPRLAAGFVGSFTLGFGQYCTKPGLLLAPTGSNAAQSVASALGVVAPEPMMLTEHIARGVGEGLERLVAAGARVVAQTPISTPGWSAPAAVLEADAGMFVAGSGLLEECFGAVALVAEYADDRELDQVLSVLQGSLAASVMAADEDADAVRYVQALSSKVGRVMVNDWPTGVAYTWAQHHGGPWPATSSPGHTSVGAAALARFVRPVAYQSVPDGWLPAPLQRANPWRLPRRVNGRPTAILEGAR